MLKNESLTAASFVMSLLAIVFSVAKFNFSPSTDAFVGIMAGLIGVCATIMVGYQIFSILDTKNQLKEIKELQSQLKFELASIKADNAILKRKNRFSECNIGGITLSIIQPFDAFKAFHEALLIALSINDINNTEKALSNLEKQTFELIKKWNEGEKFNYSDLEGILQLTSTKIEENELSKLISSRYEYVTTKMKELITNIKNGPPIKTINT